MTVTPDLTDRLSALPIWNGPIAVEPMAGGMTNRNLLVTDRQGAFVVRVAGDSATHGIDRNAERAATQAAAQCGLGPELVWAEPGLMILRRIGGRTLAAADFTDRVRLHRALDLLMRVRREMPVLYRGPYRDRSMAAILADYAARLETQPNRRREAARRYRPLIERLPALLAAVPAGFAHNDVHGDNIIDDGGRLWLLDWEYAGQGQPLADIASLVNNAGLDEEAAAFCLSHALGRLPVQEESEAFAAMRLAAALRDLFWGYVQDALVADRPGELDAYVAINEERVSSAAARL